MMKAPPPLPEETFQRVLRLARFDGVSVLAVAGLFALLAAVMRDFTGAAVGVIVAGAGAMELHGATLLRHGEPRGMRWLVGSQLFLLAGILGYCALRIARPELAPLRAIADAVLSEQLEDAGLNVDRFLAQFYRLFYLAVGFVSVLYQGGMAIYYQRRRGAVAAALAAE